MVSRTSCPGGISIVTDCSDISPDDHETRGICGRSWGELAETTLHDREAEVPSENSTCAETVRPLPGGFA